jgi:hypothetical protein
MATPKRESAGAPPLDLSKWRNAPYLLMGVGGMLAVLGALMNLRQFAFSWLLAFMFCLSICLGALFLVMVHHLFDAGWSVPIRRMCEHIASLLFPWMLLLFIPIGLLAKTLFAWMSDNPKTDHALAAKYPLFTVPMFYITALGMFAVWWLLSNRLRSWSLKQDEVGGSQPTYRMRFYSYWGIFAFAATLTGAAIMWMKGLQHQWFSTMYGVCYFAGTVWMALAMVYVITMVLDRQRVLTEVLHEHQYYFIGSLLFAFTVFHAYVNFAQYFIIWNGNIPEETFWFVMRERGSWFFISMIIIFGHFFVPFLGLLRIDVKSMFPYMTAMAVWVWLMHYFDLAFNILPVDVRAGFPWQWMWLHFGCIAFMLGLLLWRFLGKLGSAAPYPLKDPRLLEAMGHYHPVPTQISGGELDQTDDLRSGPRPVK